MSSKVIIGLVIAVAVIGGGAYFLMRGSLPGGMPIAAPLPAPAPAPAPTPSGVPTPSAVPTPAGTPAPAAPGEQVVGMTAQGFAPASLSVSAGTTVRFVNRDSVPHWPASGVHPTHQVCPGFDALEPIAPGAAYTHTFTAAKACPMHDHLNPGTRGTITVQ